MGPVPPGAEFFRPRNDMTLRQAKAAQDIGTRGLRSSPFAAFVIFLSQVSADLSRQHGAARNLSGRQTGAARTAQDAGPRIGLAFARCQFIAGKLFALLVERK